MKIYTLTCLEMGTTAEGHRYSNPQPTMMFGSADDAQRALVDQCCELESDGFCCQADLKVGEVGSHVRMHQTGNGAAKRWVLLSVERIDVRAQLAD